MKINQEVLTYRQWVHKRVDEYLSSTQYYDWVLAGSIADFAIRQGPDAKIVL